MNIATVEEIEERARYLRVNIIRLAKAKLYAKHDAAHKAGRPGANDPRYLSSYLELQEFAVVLGEVEVIFAYTGSLSGQEVVYLTEDDLQHI